MAASSGERRDTGSNALSYLSPDPRDDVFVREATRGARKRALRCATDNPRRLRN